MTAAKVVYMVTFVLLVESFLQWLCLEYLNVKVFIDNSAACLAIFVVGLNLIILHRFVYCQAMPVWVQGILVLSSVEFTIIGAGHSIIELRSPFVELAACVMSVSLLFAIFSLVGAYMTTTDDIHFVGAMCLWIFLCLISCVVVLTMLAIQWHVMYTNIFVMSAFPAILFSISYDSRIINSPDNRSMTLAHDLRYGLFLYGEFVLLLAIMLNLMKQQRE